MTFVALILAVGGMALGAAQYQRSTFENTTSQIEDKIDVVTKLTLALVELADPLPSMLYSLGGPDQFDQHLAAYNSIRDRIDADFHDAETLISTPAAATILTSARESWQAMVAAVEAAPDLIASGAVAAGIATGLRRAGSATCATTSSTR